MALLEFVSNKTKWVRGKVRDGQSGSFDLIVIAVYDGYHNERNQQKAAALIQTLILSDGLPASHTANIACEIRLQNKLDRVT